MTMGKGRGMRTLLGVLLRFLGRLVATLLLLTMGALFLAAGVRDLRFPSAHFEPVEATVLSSRPATNRGAPDTSSRNSWSVTVPLLYRYEVDGDTYQSSGILDLGRVSSLSAAEQRAAAAAVRYAPGARVEAFVDPDDPARSVLERRGAVWAIPVLAFGAVFLLTALGYAVMGIQDGWRRRRGAGTDPAAAERAIDRWLNRAAIVLLVVLALSAIAIGIEREPLTWTVLLGIMAVVAVKVWLDRRR
jgi:hypothetical protein